MKHNVIYNIILFIYTVGRQYNTVDQIEPKIFLRGQPSDERKNLVDFRWTSSYPRSFLRGLYKVQPCFLHPFSFI